MRLRAGEVQQSVDHQAQSFRGPHRRQQARPVAVRRPADRTDSDRSSRSCSGARSNVNGVRSSWLTF